MDKRLLFFVHVCLLLHCGILHAGDLPDEELRTRYEGFDKIYDALTRRDAVKVATLQRFDERRPIFERYDRDDPASVAVAYQAIGELFDMNGVKNLENVHWLLKIGAVPPELSARIATIRNDMVRDVCHEMAIEYGELHRLDFSPATNLLNDIDQTFRALEDRGQGSPDGVALKDEFRRRFTERFRVDPEFMDVVSHPFEARIPSWEKQAETHEFVTQLRKGSGLLSNNSEAYFLEGAFRMQIERRSFESDQFLYTVFGANGNMADARVGEVQVFEKRGTAAEMVYKFKRPHFTRTYAFGSSVGNWYFFRAHGEGVRFAAKYGLRSFGEGPGWLFLPEDFGPNDSLPKTYEQLVDLALRNDVFDRTWGAHFEGKFDLPKEELRWALETSKRIRDAKDRYAGERESILESKAREFASSEDLYRQHKESYLEVAEMRLESTMRAMMLFNMEATLPARVGDWLEPKVNIHHLGHPPEAVAAMSEETRRKLVKEAEKRLRVSALFEVLHGLHVMEPEMRKRAIERAKEAHPRFARTLDAVLRLAEEKPVMLLTDEEAGRTRRVVAQEGNQKVKVLDVDDIALLEDRVAEAEATLRQSLTDLEAGIIDEVVRPAGLLDEATAAGSEAFHYAATDFKRRFDDAIDEAKRSLGHEIQFFTEPKLRQVATRRMRKEFLESFGFEFRKDWKAIESIKPTDYSFSMGTFLANTVNLGNADTVINIARAYRSGGGDPDRTREAVGNAILLEAATRLPIVSTGMQVVGALQGDLVGGGVMLVSFLYPGVGQAYMFYNVADNAWTFAVEVNLDHGTGVYLQGHVPNEDGSEGPAAQYDREGQPVKLVGVLEPIFADLVLYRSHLVDRMRDPAASPEERERIQKLLKDVYPLNVEGARNRVYGYYAPRLEEKMNEAGIPEEERVAKLLSLNLPALYEEETDIDLERANLPPMLKAYFGRVLRDYREAKNEFWVQGAAAQNPVLKYRHYFTDDDHFSQTLQEIDGNLIVPALTHAFANALRARQRGEEPILEFDLDAWHATSAKDILYGRSGDTYARHLPDGTTYEGVVPDAPSILSVYEGSTFEEQCASFFAHHDAILDGLLANKRPKPIPEEERENYKLGIHHTDLRDRAAEEGWLRYSLLFSFFNKELKAFWAKHPLPSDDDWLGAPPLPREKVQQKVAAQLANDFVAGLMRDLGERQRKRDEELLRPRLPHANALDRAVASVLGDGPSDFDAEGRPGKEPWESEQVDYGRRETLRLLGLCSGDPHPFEEEEERGRFFYADELARAGARCDIEIVPPDGPITEESLGRFQCRIEASRHYRRPFHCEWAIQGAGSAAKPSGVTDTNMLVTALPLGEDLREKTVAVTVEVTDSSDPPQVMGRRTAQVTLRGKPKQEITWVPTRVGCGGDAERILLRVYGWPSLDLRPEMYDAIRDGEVFRKEYVWLARLDYDGRTIWVIQEHDWRDGSPSRELGAFGSTIEVDLPISHTGNTPLHVTLYTGSEGMPVIEADVPYVVPGPSLVGWRSQEDVAAAQVERQKNAERARRWEGEWNKAWAAQGVNDREFDQRYSHFKNWWSAAIPDPMQGNYEFYWQAENWRAELQRAQSMLQEANGIHWFKRSHSSYWEQTVWDNYLTHNVDLYLRHGCFAEADALMKQIEGTGLLPPGPVSQSQKLYGNGLAFGNTFNDLMQFSLEYRCDPAKFDELRDRYTALAGADRANEIAGRFDRYYKRAVKARAFFPAAAFR